MSKHSLPQEQSVPPVKKALILGNGPSASRVDFANLGVFDVFGMNAAYRHWEQINWYPQYYSCLDLVVGKSHANDIQRLIENAHINGIMYFLLRQNLIETFGEIANIERVVNFDVLQTRHKKLRVQPITTGSHTAAWAVILGYKDLFLMGVDCNYVERVEGAIQNTGFELEITSKQDNPNYYFDDYQRVGDKYSNPNPQFEVHQESWRAIVSQIDNRSTRILNGNPNSRLSIFEFCEFESVCAGGTPYGNPSLTKQSQAAKHKHRPMSKWQMDKMTGRPFYANFGDCLRTRMPVLFRMGQLVVKTVRKFKK